MPNDKAQTTELLRQQAKVRASALAEDFYTTHDAYHRRKENLAELVEFVLNCHGDEAFSAGKKEGYDDARAN
jgi:hypothetical protein